MIKSFTFKNFKSFEQAELNLENITTLVGANSSGKSNAIEGIKILSELSQGLGISTVLDGTKNSDGFIRGGSKGCCRAKKNSFALGCLVDLDEESDLYYEVKIGVGEQVLLEGESLVKISNVDVLKTIFKTRRVTKYSEEIKVEYSNGYAKNPSLMCIRSSAVLPQMKTRMPRDTDFLNDHAKYIELMIQNLKGIAFSEPLPSAMRDYVRISDSDLKVDCKNISAVLKKMCKDTKKKKLLLEVIREFPENEVKNIGFIETDLGDVIFTISEKYNNHTEQVDARRLSDGTLRCIAIVTKLLVEEENTLVIIEELDNGVHPGRVKHLMEYITRIAQERKLDIMITTHNATLLNTLSKENLVGVSIVYREKVNGTSKFVSFVDVEHFSEMLISGGLGEAVINGNLLKTINEGENPPMNYEWMGVDI